MYIPNSLYERAPQYWLLIGVLLVILGIYLGVEVNGRFMATGVSLGLASCAWGVHILLRRSRRPGEAGAAGSPLSSD
jgi:hypothetical protein